MSVREMSVYMAAYRRRTAMLAVILALSAGMVRAAVQGSPASPRPDLSSDSAQRHEETVTRSGQVYTVEFNGVIDGTMTRDPISYQAYMQGWQPNVAVRLENVGETDVVNPWITVNGQGDWRTLKSIVAEATRGCTTDSEKARAIWEWQRNHRFHATTWDAESGDAIKAVNVYGYTLCNDEGPIIRDLWLTAGLPTRPGRPVGHCVTEVFYDGAFHLLDSDEHVIVLSRDNKTIVSEAEVVHDHDLMKRTHTYGISAAEDPLMDQFSASLYGFAGERGGGGGRIGTKHAMNFTLRPGEALEWRFTHVGKEYSGGTDPNPGPQWKKNGVGYLGAWGDKARTLLRNGKWTYCPPLDKNKACRGTRSEQNVTSQPDSSKPGQATLHPLKPGQPAAVEWRIASPYVIVGCSIECQVRRQAAGDCVNLKWSADGKKWQDLGSAEKVGPGALAASLDKLLSRRGRPTYEYFVRLEMQSADDGDAGLDAIIFDNDIQTSLLAMPELVAGRNAIRFTADSESNKVKITHSWTERTAWHPPAAVEEAVFPKDGATVEGTKFIFRWLAPAAGDPAAKIVDYHVQVCDREDMRWPVSPNFDRMISLTPWKGKAEWAVPSVGLFNPETDYWWRVRAKDSHGVWGPWSKAFKFQCAAPGVPANLKLVMAGERPAAIVWQAAAQGRKPASYFIYGSNEQGFTASDTGRVVRMGNGFCRTMQEFRAKKKNDPYFGDVKTPANVVGQGSAARFELSGTLYAFYRVAAVDEHGVASGPSDYVELPRPFVYSDPPAQAKVGQEYRYRPAATCSSGHLTCRDGYNAAFWQGEELSWAIESGGGTWLSFTNGQFVGHPGEADIGTHEVVLKVVNSRGEAARQRFNIGVEQ